MLVNARKDAVSLPRAISAEAWQLPTAVVWVHDSHVNRWLNVPKKYAKSCFGQSDSGERFFLGYPRPCIRALIPKSNTSSSPCVAPQMCSPSNVNGIHGYPDVVSWGIYGDSDAVSRGRGRVKTTEKKNSFSLPMFSPSFRLSLAPTDCICVFRGGQCA